MYGYKKEFKGNFEEAEAKTRKELQKEGFGILTEIDVKATLKKKLDEDLDNYKILGACNPRFALKALKSEKEIGLLMPCNVIIFEDNGKVFVSAILPTIAMQMIQNPELESVAQEVEEKFKKVIDEVAK
ncbi:MAG: DUF302 domain-containing protein [Candidatus Diapherotrites archaeon]